MNNTNYIVCKADQTQRDYIIERLNKKFIDEQERKSAIIYVAVDTSNEIIGRIIVKERDVPAPLEGKFWFIDNLFVCPEWRRKGIASALVAEIKKQAELSNIVYLYGSANASAAASMFWLNQGFTLNAYGKKQEDISEPLVYGNYHHLFSYCIRRRALSGGNRSVCIKSAAKNEILQLVNTYTTNKKRRDHFLSKADELFGFIAIGESDEIKGAILAYPDSMQAPLDRTRWWITLFILPEHRNQGIGRALVWKMYQHAQEKDVIQLTNCEETEDNIGFWYELGFDIFFWGVNAQTGRRSTTAMIRVK